MTRPTGPLPFYSTDSVWNAPGKVWDGLANKVALSSDELAQDIGPGRLSAEKLAWKLNAIDKWLQYLDGIEAKNWRLGGTMSGPSGAHEFRSISGSRLWRVPLSAPHVDSAGSTWSGFAWTFDGTGDLISIPLQLTNGDVVTHIDVYVTPGAHSATPASPPLWSFDRKDVTQDASATSITSKTDATVHPAYDALHSFGADLLHVVDTTQYAYFLAFRDESGANSAAGLILANATLTIAETVVAMTAYDVPGGIYLPDFARHSLAWNPVRELFFSVVVPDHVTTPISSASGSEWSSVPTGLSASTRSTVNLTFTVSGTGSANAGDAFSDGSHVWMLNSNQSWTGSGSKGPYAATIYSPGSPAYYGPIVAPANTITTMITPNATVTAVTNASDATPGVSQLGGDGSSVAVDALGGMLFNPTGSLWYMFGPNASGSFTDGEWRPGGSIDEAFAFWDTTYDSAHGVFFAAGVTSLISTSHPSLWYVTATNNADPVASEETLPNASSYTVTHPGALVAASSVGVVAIYHVGSGSRLWTSSGPGDAYTDQGVMAIDGHAVALEWSATDGLFVLATNTGHVYTSSSGVEWEEPFGGAVASSLTHLAIVGGSWLFVGDVAQQVFLWTGSQGRTWHQAPVPWEGGFLVSLCALNGGFGAHHVAADGTATFYRSLAVFSGG